MATSQVALSSVLRRWGLRGSWQEAEPTPHSSARPPFPSNPHAQMSPQPTQTDGQEVLSAAGAGLAQAPACMLEKKERIFM